MPEFNILVCGAGIAGSTLAYFLAQAGCHVTLVERAPSMRNDGLGIDVRGPAVTVLREMGLEESVRSKTTGEEGLAFVDSSDKIFGYFGMNSENLEFSPTSDIEIMRSELAKLISSKALQDKEFVKVEFGKVVEKVEKGKKDGTGILVTYSNGESAEFDLVVAADGLGSRTRKIMLEASGNLQKDGFVDPVHSVGQYTAYYSLPREEQDGKLWKWYNAPGRRALMTRPKTADQSCAYLSIMPTTKETKGLMRELMKKPIPEQKKEYAKLFVGEGWQESRLLSALHSAEDFYLQHIAQVKLPIWHFSIPSASSTGNSTNENEGDAQSCLVVVGDAAYCPTPLSGVGTSLALLGAYILAGELSLVSSKSDISSALAAYEAKLRPYVQKKQSLPPGVPWIANPQTWVGVATMNWIIWFVAWSGVVKWFLGGNGGSSSSKGDKESKKSKESESESDEGFVLPKYRFTR